MVRNIARDLDHTHPVRGDPAEMLGTEATARRIALSPEPGNPRGRPLRAAFVQYQEVNRTGLEREGGLHGVCLVRGDTILLLYVRHLRQVKRIRDVPLNSDTGSGMARRIIPD